MLFEHKTGDEVDERVRPADASENERQLLEKSKTEGSGWSRVDEDAPEQAAAPAEDVKPETRTRPPKGPNAASGAESTAGGEGK